MATKKQGWAGELLEVVSMLPWPAGIVLAVIAYGLLHWLASSEPLPLADARQAGNWGSGVLLRSLASVGQYFLPAIFLLGAGFSALNHRRKADSGGPNPFLSKSSRPPPANVKAEPDRYGMWKESPIGDWKPAPIDTGRWSLELLNQLEWKRFEQVCAGYFRELGFRAEVAREGADGGVDIHLFSEGSSVPGIVVQCKAWKSHKVGIKQVRELFGVMAADRVTEGIFVTTGTFTGEARGFADGRNVHLIDGADLLGKLRALEPDRQQVLLGAATEGDYTTPTCPSCGIRMVQRRAKDGDEPFWGCPNFPQCRTTLNIARERQPS